MLLESDKVLEVTKYIVTGGGIIAALVTLIAAFKSGVLTRVRLGSFEFEASKKETDQARAIIQSIVTPDREPIPFETEQLAQYYAQVLAQSRTSFWFSLVFASIGFLVIILAVFLNASATSLTTIAQISAGVIIDAVAALFFSQSKAAQTAMGDFFEKLRKDRQQIESRKLCESIVDAHAKDALKIQLALHYAGLDKSDAISKSIIDATLQTKSLEPKMVEGPQSPKLLGTGND